MKTKRILSALFPGLLIMVLAMTTASFIGPDPVDEVRMEYNVDEEHVAVKGYSVVAYHRDQKPIKGSSRYSHEHNGINYQFQNPEELALFTDAPEKYLPKYGGYCAYGVSIGKRLDINPKNFKMIDGELYLFLLKEDFDSLKEWEKHNEKKMADKADAKWEVLSRVW
ncbi:MAG: YHS domain-containing (seleno)protein [Cytophagales bacterium]|nr:YHS domain-containing (seleno)protein [Cytophagales bacterium]